MLSRFTAVTSCRLDTGITTRKSDITVQIFQLMLSVPIGCCGFFSISVSLSVFVFEIGTLSVKLTFFFFFWRLVVSGHLGLQQQGNRTVGESREIPNRVVVMVVVMVIVVVVVEVASVREVTGVTFCRRSGNDAVQRHSL